MPLYSSGYELFILLFCNLWSLTVGIIMNIIIIVFRGMKRLAIFLTI